MLKAILGKKLNMTRVFDQHGRSVPVTNILAGPATIYQLKNKEKDGYASAQIGFGLKKHPQKPLSGHIRGAKVTTAPRFLREVPVGGDMTVGEIVTVKDVFRRGDMVDVVGTSKGKGFAGVVKRHGFAGGPRTHGQSDRLRAPGSIGATTTPGRVFRGVRMAGHMGAEQVTTIGLEIIQIDPEENLIAVKGAVPGPTGELLIIKKSKKKRKGYHEPEIPVIPHIGGAEEEKPAEEVEKVIETPQTETQEESLVQEGN